MSIIEILIAVALIAGILTAMSINMVYTQRSIANSRLRSRATDQAASCLNKIRNMRDNNGWSTFCNKLNSAISECNNTVDKFKDPEHNDYNGSVNQVPVNPTCLSAGQPPNLSATPPSNGNPVTVTVEVKYSDFSGQTQYVRMAQHFTR
jgi:type II secretory pathway pseudopilin PulG